MPLDSVALGRTENPPGVSREIGSTSAMELALLSLAEMEAREGGEGWRVGDWCGGIWSPSFFRSFNMSWMVTPGGSTTCSSASCCCLSLEPFSASSSLLSFTISRVGLVDEEDRGTEKLPWRGVSGAFPEAMYLEMVSKLNL